ncbi:MAG: hypothetical protein COV76_00025 [Candidatus Omnitrophica bacterium CG11_big_fil_rev_8_21_14_0_20_64_10]|nr:MAG: hypothetical protein COV76_00025 [Candidatus Omnitrophica bacterium CG11_big_fil_rev_8_21_14_0_20_64_10]
MTVGFVGNLTPPVGGAEIFLERLLARRSPRRRSVVVRWRRQKFFYFPEQVIRRYAPRPVTRRRFGCPVHFLFDFPDRRAGETRRRFEERLLAGWEREGQRAGRIFSAAGVRVIHGQMLAPHLLLTAAAARAAGVPWLAAIHGMLEFRLLDYFKRRWPAVGLRIEAAFLKTPLIAAVSDEAAAEARRRGARRVVRFRVGIDTRFFSWSGRPGRDILFVGSVRREKGAELLIRAFERIQDRLPARLVFAGPVLLTGPVLARARRNGRIRFLGTQTPAGVRRAMRAARLIALPSGSEGMPLSILEGMAAGRVPVAGGGAGELKQLLQDGRNGFLVQRRTVPDWAGALTAAWRRPDLERIGRAARRTALRFNIARAAGDFERAYRRLIHDG